MYLSWSWNNNTILKLIPWSLKWSTNLTHKFDPRVWPASLTHEDDLRLWPQEWATSLNHENYPRVWPTRPMWITQFSSLLHKLLREKSSWCILRKWRLNICKSLCEIVFLINLHAGILLLNCELLSSKIILRDFDQMKTFQCLLLVPVQNVWKVPAKEFFYHKYWLKSCNMYKE